MKAVFILCDTLRYDHVTPEIMPFTAKMAEEGSSYTMFFGDGGHTKWSMPHFFCGQKEYEVTESFPYKLTQHGVENRLVHSNAVLVHEKYQECFQKYTDMGMEIAPMKTTLRRQLKDAGLWHKTRGLRRAITGKKAFNVPYRRAEMIFDTAQTSLDSFESGFLWIQLMDAHVPYSPPGLSSIEQMEAIKLYDAILQLLKGEGYDFSPIEIQRIKDLYAAECTYMDGCIEAFVNRNPDALIFLSSDHGDMFGENYTWSHSPGLHGVTPQLGHLPMIVYGPNIRKETYSHYNCSINVGSTILELFGVEDRVGYGRSFLDEVYEK